MTTEFSTSNKREVQRRKSEKEDEGGGNVDERNDDGCGGAVLNRRAVRIFESNLLPSFWSEYSCFESTWSIIGADFLWFGST